MRGAETCLEPLRVSRVTIADVAAAAGVSKTAVSFAFNNPERLAQATLDRVLGVANDLGYTPHPAARALSTRRSGTIGILIPQRLSTVFANPFVAELIQGLGELCEEHDLALLLVPPLDGSLDTGPRSTRRARPSRSPPRRGSRSPRACARSSLCRTATSGLRACSL